MSALFCGVMLTGCGGSAPKSGLKDNEYLGSLPALFADHDLAENAAKERLKKAEESGNWEKIAKLQADEKKASEERDAKFQEATKAEWSKANGRDIPFSVSDAFSRLNIQLGSVKIDADYPGFVVTVTAKQDFAVDHSNTNDYRELNFRVLDKNGDELDRSGVYLVYLGFNRSIPFTQGQEIQFNNSPIRGNLQVYKEPKNWVDFASIQFITMDEYMK